MHCAISFGRLDASVGYCIAINLSLQEQIAFLL